MTKGQVVFIMLLLSLIVIAIITIERLMDRSKGEEMASAGPSGFLDYDLLPEELKQKMDALKAAHYNINYAYWYFFDIDDVNKHYYITDAGMEVIYALPVTHLEALALVDEKMQNNSGKDVVAVYHPDLMINPSASKEEREKQFKKMREHKDDPSRVWIRYIFPEDTADFSRLRVAIVADNLSYHALSMYESEAYGPEEVDTLPVPARGYDYFEKVMVKELMKHDVFTFYNLKGEVTVEFTVGGTASSPNIVKGFSSDKDTYEAYKADGAFIKAFNNLKVRWKPGKVGNALVRVKMPLTFLVNGQTISMAKELNAVADL